MITTHQTIEQIFQAATPEQRLIWQELFLKFGERISISHYYFAGNVGGSELAVYSTNKLYLAYSFKIAPAATPTAGLGQFSLYDETNAVNLTMGDPLPYWDGTAAAARFVTVFPELMNFYFSRTNVNVNGRFIGFRIGI